MQMRQRAYGGRALPLLLLLAACGTTATQLHYAPTVAVAPGGGRAVVGPVTDQRGETDPNWLGAVRGGFGNPLKVLRGDQPAAAMVRQAFSDGLQARGMLASSAAGTRELRIVVRQLDVDRMARLEARVDLQVDVVDARGQSFYSDAVKLDRVQGSIIALDTGIFASTDALRDLLARTLSEAVDQLLDKPRFRQVVQARGEGGFAAGLQRSGSGA
jgi:uncharacterized lipoprotein YajG